MRYEKAKEECDKLNIERREILRKLRSYPEGNLQCSRNGEYFKWYVCKANGKEYIPKKQRKYAEKLAAKKYLTLHLKDLENEIEALNAYMKRRSLNSEAEQLWRDNAEYRRLVQPYFMPRSKKLQEWMDASFDSNPVCPEKRIHKTPSGNLVRSKSEALIDTSLFFNRIPFRYEAILQLGSSWIYPDFTIRHPETGDFYYWEHFGMMDDPAYAEKAYSRMHLYNLHGIIPSVHLITTYETKENPLTSETVEKIVKHYFG